MDFLLRGLSFDGIVTPGEVYIFTEKKDRSYDIEPLTITYVIRADHEIAPALKMEMFDIMDEIYEFIRFLGYEQMADDCYRFRMLCYKLPDRKRCVYSLMSLT